MNEAEVGDFVMKRMNASAAAMGILRSLAGSTLWSKRRFENDCTACRSGEYFLAKKYCEFLSGCPQSHIAIWLSAMPITLVLEYPIIHSYEEDGNMKKTGMA